MLQAYIRKEHINYVLCDAKCGSQAELERYVDIYHSGTPVEGRKTVECT
jgi:general transcription factor IIIA